MYTWSEYSLCEGSHAILIGQDEPTDVSCVVGCAVLNTARVRPGDSVAIFGVGGIGLSALRAAAIVDARPIIAVDLRDDKLEFAKEWGATHVVNASKTDPVEAIVELTDGGVDYAFDAIGVRATTEQILPATRRGGSGAGNVGGMAVMVGIPTPTQEMTISPRLLLGQRQYRGSGGATDPERDFPTYLRWHREGKFRLDKLITNRYRLDDINVACAALAAGEILGRAIIEY